MVDITRRAALVGGAGAGITMALPMPASAQTAVEELGGMVMRASEVPGLAMAIVKDGKALLLRGWGTLVLGGNERIDEATVFGIGSNSKAMTAAALAMLVDDGKLGWDDPVTRHLPDFAMSDPDVTRLMTVRDLLLHRSGLGLGAGDLMTWPQTTLSRAEIVHGLRHLPLVRGFRAGYDYDNILYIVAGEVVARASGMSWEDFLTHRLLEPAGMQDSVASSIRASGRANRSRPHARLGPPMRGMGAMRRLQLARDVDNFAPCGGVWASARDMAQWLKLQLGGGTVDGRRLWTAQSAEEMWRPETICATSAGPTREDPARPLFQGYALGWNVSDYRGVRAIGHFGLVQGHASQTMMIPSLGLGIAVMTNAEEEGVTSAIINSIVDHHLAAPSFDWSAFFRHKVDRDRTEALTRLRTAISGGPVDALLPDRPLTAYAGRYRDPWYGDIVVAAENGGLVLDFTRTPGMRGPLEVAGARFRTRFPSPEVEDAFVAFDFSDDGHAQALRLAAVSPLADFSYDFHDLAPRRVP